MPGPSQEISIVFTDLDGSLLNHDGYSYSGARTRVENRCFIYPFLLP